ncbi:hypothetical protein ANCDUO_10094 [Ancylostoma duodenale]|uniref:Uncharacterized protein n=1 Tax=Ancylostoma duodenale TaxID=51022 RepID=A0A0C2GRR6_9BILA|nr:hypothetical protein ANCDUO_10094 [Ancylostoma duodenale]
MTINLGQAVSQQHRVMGSQHIEYLLSGTLGSKDTVKCFPSVQLLLYYVPTSDGEDLGLAIRNSVVLPTKNARLSEKEERELFDRYKAVVQEAIARADGQSHPTHKRAKRPSELPKKPKVHRYSREERRKMREMEASPGDVSSHS